MSYELAGIDPMGLRVVTFLDVQRMRLGIVVQTGDVPQLKRQVHCRLPVHRKECAAFGGVPVDIHVYMEGSLDIRHRTCKPKISAVEGPADDLKAARFRESNQGIPILLAGTESGRNFLRHKELVVDGACGIVHFLNEILQSCAIAQGQNNVEAQRLSCAEWSH